MNNKKRVFTQHLSTEHNSQSQHKHSYWYSGCGKDIFGNTLATPVVSHHTKQDYRAYPRLRRGETLKRKQLSFFISPFLSVARAKIGEDFEGVLHYTISTRHGLAESGTREFLFTKPSQEGRWGEAGGSFTAQKAVGPSSKQAPVNFTPLWVCGALINKRDTIAGHRG